MTDLADRKGAPAPADVDAFIEADVRHELGGIQEEYIKGLNAGMIGQNVNTWLQNKYNEINTTPVKAAVCGSSGQGKSSIINRLRNLQDPDREWVPPVPHDPKSAARVGIVETTTAATKYVHDQFPNIELWDLPGVGTQNFPKDTYISKVDLLSFDYYIIVTASRLFENDVWLIEKLAAAKKPFFIVRTKVDEAIRAEVERDRARGKTPDLPAIRTWVRKQIEPDFHQFGSHIASGRQIVYLISAFPGNHDDLDFPLLRHHVIDALPSVKRNILIMGLTDYAKAMVEKKYAAARDRVWVYAGLSCGAALAPLPGVSAGADIALLVKMADEFRRSFGLTEEHLNSAYGAAFVSENILGIVKKASSFFTVEVILKMLAPYVSAQIAEELARFIPFAGSLAAGSISFYIMYRAGMDIATRMRDFALDLTEEIEKRVRTI